MRTSVQKHGEDRAQRQDEAANREGKIISIAEVDAIAGLLLLLTEL